jgi:F-type H+-transporting ATPase subunit gamma
VVANATDDIDQITLVYNEFKNAITQVLRHMDLLTKKNFLAQFKYVTK